MTPDSVRLFPGGEVQFSLQETWSDQTTTDPEVDFTTTGGTITVSGHYVAPLEPAQYLVVGTARVSGWSDTAVVDVVPDTVVGDTVATDTVAVVPDTVVVDSSTSGPQTPVDSLRHPHLPEGFQPIVDRPFNTMGAFGGDRGVGSFPSKTGGAEGWDDAEKKYANISLAADPGSPLSPGSVMRFNYPAGTVAAGTTYSPGVVQTQPFTANAHGNLQYRKVYFHFAFKLDPWFQYHTTGVKLLFMRSNSTPGGKFEPILGINGAGNLVFNCQGCEDNPRQSLAANMASASVTKGVWHQVEAVMEMNSAYGVGDGIVRIWVDGVLTHFFTDIKYLRDGTNAWFWDTVHVAPTWGGIGGTINADMAWYLDHVFVAGRSDP